VTDAADTRAWDEIASELGLQVKWGGPWKRPPMRGHFQGRVVRVKVISAEEAVGDGKSTEIAVWAKRGMPETLEIVPDQAHLRLGESLGWGDVRLGDSELDPLVKVKYDDPDAARELLTVPMVRDVLVDLFDRYDCIEVRDGAVVMEKLGVVSSVDKLRRWLSDASYLLDALEAATEGWRFEFEPEASLPVTGEVRAATPQKRPTQATTEEIRVVDLYRKRRLMGIFGGLVPAAAGFVAMGLGGKYEAGILWGMPAYQLCVLGFVVLIAGFALFLVCYRCPACGRMPLQLEQRKMDLAPASCPHCNTRLS
jgi:hypothetical protein